MQLDRQAEFARPLEQAADFRAAEADGLAEPVDRVDQIFARQRRQHLVADQRHVVGAPIRELRRQRVQAQETGAHADAQLAAESTRHAQHAAFAVQLQAVAGLDLQRGHAVGEQGAGARQGLRVKAVLAGGTGGLDGGGNAAAGARDFLVTGAVQTQVEFVGAIAAEHEMGVAVDQTGRDQGAVERFHFVGQRHGRVRQLVHPPQPGDAPVLHGDCRLFDQAVRRVVGERCQGGVQQQAVPAGRGHGRRRFEGDGAIIVHPGTACAMPRPVCGWVCCFTNRWGRAASGSRRGRSGDP